MIPTALPDRAAPAPALAPAHDREHGRRPAPRTAPAAGVRTAPAEQAPACALACWSMGADPAECELHHT
ncbi:hypothetical protein [Peterkaempfera griseoplana]|uniref:hypothetical protein n=1 Tax=Peterkaempfera griseoplana TaxID=66896 RepID=UPI0006E3BC4C|nr:hypothetical protein [Peterkaempfera griseoplana]